MTQVTYVVNGEVANLKVHDTPILLKGIPIPIDGPGRMVMSTETLKRAIAENRNIQFVQVEK